jgi:gamma-glutamylcyclotransferase (GGCT)/AIG2-like uncharacterized protein YtfP
MRSNHGQERLFVYGTLHPTKAPPEVADVVARMKSVGRGTIQGIRYELESFPAVVSGISGAGLVDGELYVLPEDPRGPQAPRRL